MKSWNDNNRFNQDGYSAATMWPNPDCYDHLDKFLEDITEAIKREETRREWLYEQREEAKYYHTIEDDDAWFEW